MNTHKRRGRPRLDPAGRLVAPVIVTFTAAQYDSAAKVAALRRESIQDVIRRAVDRELNKPAS
jgi:hypothetical protein